MSFWHNLQCLVLEAIFLIYFYVQYMWVAFVVGLVIGVIGGHFYGNDVEKVINEMVDLARQLREASFVGDSCASSQLPQDYTVVDFVADTGDGFGATMSVFATMGQLNLSVSRQRLIGSWFSSFRDCNTIVLPRAQHLVLGGDLVYHVPSEDAFVSRFLRPFLCAFESEACDIERREMVDWLDASVLASAGFRENLRKSIGTWLPSTPSGASIYQKVNRAETCDADIPRAPQAWALLGNHDVMDGGEIFHRYFLEKDSIGQHELGQKFPYFMFEVENNWIFFGIHNQHAAGAVPDIDYRQFLFLQDEARKSCGKRDHYKNAVLMMHSPAWLDASSVGPRLKDLLHQLEKEHFILVRVMLAGDLHFYSRHSRTDVILRHLIVSGGGGAFTHSTWALKNADKFPFENSTLESAYPADFDSFFESFWLFLVGFHRSVFGVAFGICMILHLFWVRRKFETKEEKRSKIREIARKVAWDVQNSENGVQGNVENNNVQDNNVQGNWFDLLSTICMLLPPYNFLYDANDNDHESRRSDFADQTDQLLVRSVIVMVAVWSLYAFVMDLNKLWTILILCLCGMFLAFGLSSLKKRGEAEEWAGAVFIRLASPSPGVLCGICGKLLVYGLFSSAVLVWFLKKSGWRIHEYLDVCIFSAALFFSSWRLKEVRLFLCRLVLGLGLFVVSGIVSLKYGDWHLAWRTVCIISSIGILWYLVMILQNRWSYCLAFIIFAVGFGFVLSLTDSRFFSPTLGYGIVLYNVYTFLALTLQLRMPEYVIYRHFLNDKKDAIGNGFAQYGLHAIAPVVNYVLKLLMVFHFRFLNAFGLCIIIGATLFSLHFCGIFEDSFAFLGISGYNNFLRIVVTPANLTIYPIGIQRALDKTFELTEVANWIGKTIGLLENPIVVPFLSINQFGLKQ
jgi:hypothetical protein